MPGRKLHMDGYFIFKPLCIVFIYMQLAFASKSSAQDLVPVLDSRTSLFFYSDSTLTPKTGGMMFDYAELFSEGMASVRLQGKWGFINTQQQFVIQPVFLEAFSFRNGFAAVIDDNGISNFCRHDGSLLCKTGFDITRSFSGDLASVATNNKWGYVDSTGTLAIAMDFDRAEDFSEGLAAVKKDGKWGFIDQSGKFVITAIYDGVTSFSQNMAGVEKDGHIYYINGNGQTVFTVPDASRITGINPFCNGRAWVKSGTEWQLLDMKGNVIGKMTCEIILPSSDGYSLFKSGGQWGFLDANGKVVIEAQFPEVLPFENGYAKIFTTSKFYLIDKRGKIYIKNS